ncbi:MAG: cob(I)yrinic acid a,c-diamide adenosyltransferase [Candidatus Hodarchaeota archaeon]
MPGRIYTKKGDGGETSLFSGERVEKTSTRVEAYGTIDEFNASLGIAKVYSSEFISNIIQQIQEHLFYLASELATTDSDKVLNPTKSSDVEELEKITDKLQADLPPVENFVIPGGTKSAVYLHQARTILRRAERRIIRLSQEVELNPELLKYLNRLSDLLFVMARYVNTIEGEGDLLISRDGTFLQKK